jgi:hypothetical protein
MASAKPVHYFNNVMSSLLMAIIKKVLIDEKTLKRFFTKPNATPGL